MSILTPTGILTLAPRCDNGAPCWAGLVHHRSRRRCVLVQLWNESMASGRSSLRSAVTLWDERAPVEPPLMY
ncbi:hypothetical protein EYF80_047513 [Liparis tanakae]|uniref:Uncharacterized protein n=1 Tax=Liparis tanakae TaxID=230148 RepID=A0A4Z2FMS2_9TELE|nr:hypothetical protein EYF80_047513 [Liparis tanakae]